MIGLLALYVGGFDTTFVVNPSALMTVFGPYYNTAGLLMLSGGVLLYVLLIGAQIWKLFGLKLIIKVIGIGLAWCGLENFYWLPMAPDGVGSAFIAQMIPWLLTSIVLISAIGGITWAVRSSWWNSKVPKTTEVVAAF